MSTRLAFVMAAALAGVSLPAPTAAGDAGELTIAFVESAQSHESIPPVTAVGIRVSEIGRAHV